MKIHIESNIFVFAFELNLSDASKKFSQSYHTYHHNTHAVHHFCMKQQKTNIHGKAQRIDVIKNVSSIRVQSFSFIAKTNNVKSYNTNTNRYECHVPNGRENIHLN